MYVVGLIALPGLQRYLAARHRVVCPIQWLRGTRIRVVDERRFDDGCDSVVARAHLVDH